MRASLILMLVLAACGGEEPPTSVIDDDEPPVDVPAEVVVRVIDHGDGRPLARADVRLERGREKLATAKTGPDGTFDFGVQPAGEYVVRANYSGGTYVPTAERIVLDGTSGIRLDLVLRAFEGQRLRVTVPEGVAMPRVVEIQYTKLTSAVARPILTKIPLHEDGTATMRRLPPARYHLRFHLSGCAPIELEHEIQYADNEPLQIGFERR